MGLLKKGLKYAMFWPFLIPLLYLKIDFFLLVVLPFRLVMWLVTSILGIGLHTGEAIERGIKRTVELVENHRIILAAYMLLILYLMSGSFSLSNLGGLASVGLLIQFIIFFLVPIIPLTLFFAIKERGNVEIHESYFSNGMIEVPGQEAAGAAGETLRRGGETAARNAANMAQEGDLRAISEGLSSETVKSDLVNILGDTVQDVAADDAILEPIIEAVGGEAVLEGGGAALATAGSEVIVPVLLGLLIGFLLQFIVVAIVYFIAIFLLSGVIGGILQPVAEATGAGAAWGSYAGSSVNNRLAGVVDTEEIVAPLKETGAKISCFASGPACMRQWRANHTSRPDSRDVGETYGLKIEDFELGSGSNFDVAYKPGDYAVPVDFTVSNPRHGLDGIKALDTYYRVKIIDGAHQGENALCGTGWRSLKAYNIAGDKANDIYPGTYGSPDNRRIREKINITGCGLRQPGNGGYKKATLEVKYNYSTQATLYFRVMSRKYLSNNERVTKDEKSSVTYDTPVKAALGVEEPVLFTERSGKRRAQPFTLTAALNRDDNNVEYKVNDLLVKPSRMVGGSSGGSCDFVFEGGKMTLNEDMKGWLKRRQGRTDDTSKEDGWMSTDSRVFRCTMNISEEALEGISRTGETLKSDIFANYTVKVEEQMESFQVENSLCANQGTYDCPLLVPKERAVEKEHLTAECTSIDARSGGCDVVEPETWTSPRVLTHESSVDKLLEYGETAYRVRNLGKEFSDFEVKQGGKYDGEAIVGLTESKIERAEGGSWILFSRENEAELEELNICRDGKWSNEEVNSSIGAEDKDWKDMTLLYNFQCSEAGASGEDSSEDGLEGSEDVDL